MVLNSAIFCIERSCNPEGCYGCLGWCLFMKDRGDFVNAYYETTKSSKFNVGCWEDILKLGY